MHLIDKNLIDISSDPDDDDDGENDVDDNDDGANDEEVVVMVMKMS